MAPRQNEAGAHPAGVHPHDENLRNAVAVEVNVVVNNENEALLPESDTSDSEVDDENVEFHHHVNRRARMAPPAPPPVAPVAPIAPRDAARMSDIRAKFESLGNDLVMHIVVASMPATPPRNNNYDAAVMEAPDASSPFPPSACVSGVSFLNLLTTDRETLTMRRLVTKALVDKSHSFNAMIYILPRIPTSVDEFRETFGAVVDRMIYVPSRRDDDALDEVDGAGHVDDVVANVTWGKIVTAYAFGIRLIKAAVDLRRNVLRQIPIAEQQQQQQHAPQQPQQRHLHDPLSSTDFVPNVWGSALGRVMHERMGEWVLSRGGWNDGFNDYFLDRRGLEQAVTKKLFYVLALGVGVALVLKLFR